MLVLMYFFNFLIQIGLCSAYATIKSYKQITTDVLRTICAFFCMILILKPDFALMYICNCEQHIR